MHGSMRTWRIHAALGVLASVFMVILFYAIGDCWGARQILPEFFISLVAMGYAWVCGLVITRAFTENGDLMLAWISPLTPRLFLRRALNRLALPIVCLYGLCPAALILGLPSPKPVLFIIGFLLAYWLTLAIPVRERLAGRAPWTAALYLVRHPLRRLGPLLYPSLFILVVTTKFWAPHVVPALQRAVVSLPGAHASVQLGVFLAAPLPGLCVLHLGGSGPWPWIVTVALAVWMGECLVAIAGVWRRPVLQFDQEQFEAWVSNRENWERELERLEETASRKTRGQPPAPPLHPVRDENWEQAARRTRERADIYREGWAPERVLLDTVRRARQPDSAEFSLRRMVSRVLMNIDFFVLIGLAGLWVAAVGRGSTAAMAVGSAGLLMAVVSGGCHAARLAVSLRLPLAVPLRWTSLWVWDCRLGGARMLAVDGLAALLACIASRTGLSGFVLLFSGLLLLRQVFFLHVWLANQAAAGSRWPQGLAVTLLILFLGSSLVGWGLGVASTHPASPSAQLEVSAAFMISTVVVLCVTAAVTLAGARKTAGNVSRPLAITTDDLHLIRE